MKNKKQNNRHELKQARRTRNVFISLTLMVAVLIISVVHINNMPKPLPSKGIPANYSLQEMQEIWTNNFQEFVDKELFGNKYSLPKIQERFNLQSRLIQERFHTNLNIHLVTTYNAESTYVMAGCWITNNEPHLDIIIPRLVDVYYEQRKQGGPQWQLRMQDDVVVSIMHERDHLAFGLVSGTREQPPSLDELVDSESKAWALTCEYTLRPMIEEYQVPLIQSDCIYYGKWVDGGRDEKSPVWRNFIRSVYQVARE